MAKAQEVVKCQKQNDPSDAVVGHLEDLMKRAEGPVNRLRHILGDHIVENFGADIERETDLEFSKRSWFKRQEEARLLRTELLEIRSKIDHACAMHSSYVVLRSRSHNFCVRTDEDNATERSFPNSMHSSRSFLWTNILSRSR